MTAFDWSAFWAGLPSDIQAAAIGAVATVVTATLGVAAIIWQVGREAAHARAQDLSSETVRLKLEIYKEAVALCRDAQEAAIDYSGFIRGAPTSLLLNRTNREAGFPGALPKERVPKLLELERRFSDAAVRVLNFIETWLVVDPRINVFNRFVNVAMHDAREAFPSYFQLALSVFPKELPPPDGVGLLPWTLPPPEVEVRLKDLGDKIIDPIMDFGAYVGDLKVEMQNLLVSELFGNRAPSREPIDPKYKAIRLENYEELMRHFGMTPAGKHFARVEAESRARVAAQAEVARATFRQRLSALIESLSA